MNYMLEVVAFEEWFETHSLSISAQLLWHKLMYLNYKNGWDEWVQLDNKGLMRLIEVKNESTLIRIRKELIQSGLIEYQMGKKGSPSRYKIKSILEEKRETAAAMSEDEPSVAVSETNKEEVIKSTAKVSRERCTTSSSVGKVPGTFRTSIGKSVVSVSDGLKLSEKFWEVYPRKKSKALAEKAYVDIILHTTGISEEKILAAAYNYAKECKKLKKEEKFIKLPHNWLKDLAWIDYLPENYKEQEPDPEPAKECDSRIVNNRFNNMQQRTYDFERLEKELLGN